MTNDDDVVTRGASKCATVSNLVLNVGHDGTLRDGAKGENVANGKLGLLASVNKLTSVKALVSNEGLGASFVVVRIAEDDLGEGSSTAGVVDDLFDETSGVTVTLGVVESSELGSTLSQTGVGLENGTVLSLRSDNTTHCLTKKVWKILRL